MEEPVVAKTAKSAKKSSDSLPDNGKFQKLVDHCMELYKEFKDSPYRAAKLEEIKQSHKVYEQKADKATFPWKDAANYIIPFTTISVDNLEPRLVAGLVGTDPIVAFDQNDTDKKDPVLSAVEASFNNELKDVCSVEDFARHVVHQILLEGTYYPVPKYDKDNRKVVDFQYDQTGRIVIDDTTNEAKTVESETTVFEGGKFDYVPFNDVFCADNLGTIEDWEREPVIRIVRPTYAELVNRKTASDT